MATRSKIEPSDANLALVGGAQEANFARHEVLKALVVGRDRVQDSNALAAIEEREKLFTEAGAIEPPYDPESLCLLLEHSNSLRQNVDAYVTNIDGFGYRLEPAIDFEAEDVDEQIANAIYLERVAMRDRGELAADAPVEPKADEVTARKKELMHLARVERSRLDSFFDFCCSDHSFVTLRRRTRQDLEVLGNGFWEVLRNRGGQISRLVHVPAYTVRLLSLDEDPVEVEERVRISPVSHDTVTVRRRFRRFVQVQGNGRQVYFKEFIDPRAVSKLSGRVFSSVEELRSAGNTDGPATEMIHFAVHSPRSAYGVPRWIGTLLSVLGSRQMEEVNYLYFENKSVPPLALLVSGGRLSKSSIPRIEDFIENNIKGKRNFHKILILEAETTPNQNVQHSGKAQIKIEPLTQAQMQEELFGKYDERNMDKVGGSFRLPRLLRGESKDFNRATAQAALRFAEEQVFQPERDEFDFMINRRLFADMRIRFWRFKSNSPVTRDPERMTEMVERLVKANVLTPEEGRLLAGDVFNRDFRVIKAPWVKQPVPLTLAGFTPDGVGPEESTKADLSTSDLADAGGLVPARSGPPLDASFGARPGEDEEKKRRWLLEEARRLLRIRDELATEEARIAAEKLDRARHRSNAKVETIKVPASEFRNWFEPGDVKPLEEPIDE